MLIQDSQLQLYASHEARQRQERRESLQFWSDQGANGTGNPAADSADLAPKEREALAAQGRQGRRALALLSKEENRQQHQEVMISSQARALQPQRRVATDLAVEDPQTMASTDMRMNLLKNLMERLTGRTIKVFRPEDLQPRGAPPAVASPETAAGAAAGEAPPRQGWGLAYDYYEVREESESSRVQIQGQVQTADGQTLDISLDVGMSRSFRSEQSFSLRAGDARLQDPLVINFAGPAADLTTTKFNFDLDADGREDQISWVTPGSGYLALDRNEDGRINDGGELFGPRSGDGYQELAAHDQDGNGWIDEGDAIYSRLRVWSKDAEGNDQLVALGQHGIGAIYLGHIASPFSLNDPTTNEQLGQVRDTGLFLREDGSAGSVQQLDLRV